MVQALQGPGVDGQALVSSWTFQGLAAVISKVARKDFCGPEAEARFQDLTWLGPRACRHEAVVEQAMRLSPVLPARFGTLFSSRKALEGVLKKHHAAICRFLDQVADKEEWAVKGLLDRKKARGEISSTIFARQKELLSSFPQGMRYFQEQRMLADADRELNGWVKKTCEEVMEDLRQQAADFRYRPVLCADLGKEGMQMISNCALLVPRRAVAGLRARTNQANARHRPRGLLFELSGPWPPYSFSPSLLTTAEA